MLEHTHSNGHVLPKERVICHTLQRKRRKGRCKDKTATKKPSESNKSPHTRTATRATSNEQPVIVFRDTVTNTATRTARKQRDDSASNPSVSNAPVARD